VQGVTKSLFSYLQNVVLSEAKGANNQSAHRETMQQSAEGGTIEQCNNKEIKHLPLN